MQRIFERITAKKKGTGAANVFADIDAGFMKTPPRVTYRFAPFHTNRAHGLAVPPYVSEPGHFSPSSSGRSRSSAARNRAVTITATGWLSIRRKGYVSHQYRARNTSARPAGKGEPGK